MSSHHVLKLQQSVQASLAGCAAAGGWKLAAGQAVSLRTNTPGVLEIARGRVWLTLGGSFNHLPGAAVDHVLHAGERLAIAPGQQVVMEAWNPSGGGDVAAFRWEAGTAPAKAPAASAVARDWENGVVQPLRDLVHALAQGRRAMGAAVVNVAGAGGRCAAGLARFVGRWITHQRQRTTCSVLP
ncbi:MAG: DUF2917 domain-containing protein [Gammaproteobacteria bacterium]|uniref:DUF2917 domain-containing protein n=1 Tax=Acidovorax sp. JG5 TaxID=2822718 RepID=UPI001B331CDA|nr:DUF2917 domain-containing protein [Acidovorax sp. JG5]MBP3981700.1 DUF2917 domain-containing protein [Acidovorax sp. JG5]MBU4425090.1 DUF2917 domain-containing protein [Gammaproteobacteria bacterium]